MSHFTCLVAAKDHEELKRKLLPYHEYECTGIKEYLVWIDTHDEHLKEFNEGTIECVYKNGHLLGTKYSDHPEIKALWKRTGIGISNQDEFVLSEGYELREVSMAEAYGSFEGFMENYCGYDKKEHTDEKGRYGRWTNPNKRWDWWVVGGRWTGTLHLKYMTPLAGNGEPGCMTDANTNKWHADYAPASVIDWEGMREEHRRRALNEHRYYHELLEKHKNDMPDSSNLDHYNQLISRRVGFEKVWPTYRDYEIFKAAEKDLDKAFGFHFFDVDSLLDMSLPEEKFMAKLDDSVTFAFIDSEGNWVEKGSMGWFGMHSKECEHEGYNEKFWRFVESLPGDMLVWVVDCHI